MARFRQYKNGIFGHRYKGLYITRNNSNRWKNGKLYSMIDENGNPACDPGTGETFEESPDFEDCEWFIDKLKASEEEMALYRKLYDCSIPELYRIKAKYSRKTEEGTITKEEKALYTLVEKVMKRKDKDMAF